ncbi:MAG: DNA-binding response regulator [Helicobacteraceae bacterium]|nr:DNA-binding response regulator [Helicobacteraceae bacterium]
MRIVIFSQDPNTIEYINAQLETTAIVLNTVEELEDAQARLAKIIILCDYDSVSQEVNEYFKNNNLPKNIVILEKNPNVTTGKSVIHKGARAYGHSRMLKLHLTQLLETVQSGKYWTYPELTASMVKSATRDLDIAGAELLDRLSTQEKKVTLLILEGLTNVAISENLEITPRTVKAHISSIFEKLNVVDRLSLVLLLK